MKTKFTLLLLTVFLAFLVPGTAQVPSLNPVNGVVPAILNAAGGSYDDPSSYHRYEWSFGEMLLVQAFAPPDSSILVTQGVLQPCTDVITGSPYTVLFEAGDYKLFPNPTSGKFELDFFIRTPGQMSLQLVNSLGQVLKSRSYHYDGCCRIELFDISHLPNGVYFVVADLKPDNNRPGDNLEVRRHSGFKVVKLNEK
jgi:hypothetical protein